MGKAKEIIVLISVLLTFVALALLLGFMGVKNTEYNYVKLEVNPKLEFVTDNSHKIVSVLPINKEAKELIINETFLGLSAEEGAKKFVDLCVQANYIDVETQDNAIKLTVITGLTEALDVKIYGSISKYLLNNQINCVIVENESDLDEFKEAKKYGVSSNKFALMESVCNLYPDLTLDSAKKLNEKEMLNKIKTAHQNLLVNTTSYTEDELNNKVKLINFNRAKLAYHKEQITSKTQSQFADDYKQFVRDNQKQYETNFNKQYVEWQSNKTNTYLA